MKHLVIPGLEPKTPINTIFCIGRNYADHAREMKSELPDQPVVFTKPLTSIIFDGGSILLPRDSDLVHHEVEMVVAIGREGKHISPEHAMEYVLGYGIGIDVTARDKQNYAKKHQLPWTVAKGYDTFAPISQFVSADEVDDPHDLSISMSVNGEKRQGGHTKDMIFDIPKLISHLSGIFTLGPGDLLFTGTPSGVSTIKNGDVIRATLGEKLVTLNIMVTNEPYYPIK